MSHLALADYLDDLQHEQRLVRIAAEVDPDLELGAIAERVLREQGPALVFANLRGQEFPLAANLLASADRICRALGVKSLAETQEQALELLRQPAQAGWLDSLRMAHPQARWAPRPVKNGACQQVVRLASDIDLGQLLRVRWWPEEEAPSLPAALAVVQAPDDAWRSIELCSVTLVDRQRLLLTWEPHRGLARLWHECVRQGQRLPLALALGGHPVETLLAAAPLSAEADRWSLCGWLRGRPCDLVRSRTLPVDVPADAEIIVEGFLDPAAPRPSAPRRAEANGLYSLPGEGVVMEVTALTHRTNPIQVAIPPARPPNELTAVREAMLSALKPLVLAIVPGLVDYHFAAAGGCRHVATVAIRKNRPQQGRQLAGALWALEPWMFARLLVIVDDDADVQDEREILHRVIHHADLARDVFHQQAPHEAGQATAAAAALMGIDATRKLPGEQSRPRLGELSRPARIEEQVLARWHEYGLAEAAAGRSP
jgi:4-hydroxy-3-polyprenylbenzoate decarboxylase